MPAAKLRPVFRVRRRHRGHVFTAMIAHAFDNGNSTRIANCKTLAGNTAKNNIRR